MLSDVQDPLIVIVFHNLFIAKSVFIIISFSVSSLSTIQTHSLVILQKLGLYPQPLIEIFELFATVVCFSSAISIIQGLLI